MDAVAILDGVDPSLGSSGILWRSGSCWYEGGIGIQVEVSGRKRDGEGGATDEDSLGSGAKRDRGLVGGLGANRREGHDVQSFLFVENGDPCLTERVPGG